MLYIKIFNESGEAASVEALSNPVYVYVQPRNGRVLRCERRLAQGVLDVTGSKIYQLQDKAPVPGAVATAAVITTAEYQELEATLGQTDPEDEIPEVPEGAEGETIMTRAELTAKVLELDEAMEMILSGVTE